MGRNADRLTEIQRRFVEEVVADPAISATEAYRRAGYTAKGYYSLASGASKLLKLPKIRNAIEAARAERRERMKLQADRVLEELAALVHSNREHFALDAEGNLVLADGAPSDAMRAISGCEVVTSTDADGNVTRKTKFRLWDKPAALRLALTHLGLLVERHQHEVVKPVEFVEIASSRREGKDGG
jgi:hypothetical protein